MGDGDDDCPVYWYQYPPGSKFWRAGGSGGLYFYPSCSTELIKVPSTKPSSIKNMEIEKRIYKRLGSHPNIVPCLRIDDTGILLKRAEHGAIREFFAEGGTATMEERIKWSRDIAIAIQYLHEHGIRHADLGGRNLLLDSSRTILLCDFAGSGIDGEPPTVWAESGFKHPKMDENELGTIRAELHALGSTIYEIITSSQPHGKAEEWIVHQWIQEGKYPDVKEVKLGDIITKCWKGEFESAGKVAQTIEREIRFVGFQILLRHLTLL
jgi:serine/threonine protein kinase